VEKCRQITITGQFVIKILEDIDITDILSEYHKLDPNINWTQMGHKGKQTGLQYKLESDPWTGAWSGFPKDENGKNYTKETWQNAVGRNKGMELTYNQLNPFFKDSVFEEIIKKYRMYRTRLMWVNGMSCYSIHRDSTPRIHIPLITNPECYFVFKDDNSSSMTYMKVGHVYWVDTRKKHTFMNCSEIARLHLVGVVEH
jgi:hypothetical protein